MSKPAFLYKYYVVNDYLKPVLTENKIYFAPPRQFNDPFDCKTRLTTEMDPEKLKIAIAKIIDRTRPSLSANQRQRIIDHALSKPSSWIQTQLDEMQEDFLDEAGVFCLTSSNNNIPMWAHYADSNRGVCLEFKLGENPPCFNIAEPIIYSDKYPIIDFFQATGKDLAVALKTKSTHWEYESEWRIFHIALKDEVTVGLFDFPSEYLTGVVFGYKIDAEKEEKARSWIATGKSKPIFYRARPAKDRYFLEIINT